MARSSPCPIFTLRYHNASVTTLGFSSLLDSQCLLSGDAEGKAVLWNLSTRRCKVEWTPHPNSSVLKVETKILQLHLSIISVDSLISGSRFWCWKRASYHSGPRWNRSYLGCDTPWHARECHHYYYWKL